MMIIFSVKSLYLPNLIVHIKNIDNTNKEFRIQFYSYINIENIRFYPLCAIKRIYFYCLLYCLSQVDNVAQPHFVFAIFSLCFGLKHIFWLGDDFEVARSAVFFPYFFDSRYCYIHGFLRAAIEVAAVFLSDFLTDIFEFAFVLFFE